MKKGYKRLAIFQVILFLIFILNSFISNILSEYNTILFLILAMIIFKFFLGFEKDRHRNTKDIIFDVIIFLIVFFIVYYILGVFIGFAKTDNYYTYVGLKSFIIPTIVTIILKEILRYNMLKKSEESKLFIIITTALFIFLDVTNPIYYNRLSSGYDILILVALTVLPAISTNILCSYIALKTGYKPSILYLLVIDLYQYLIPIIPNPSEYIASIIQLIVPVILFYRLYMGFKKAKDEDLERSYNKKDSWILIIPILVIIISVYFTSGSFHYHAVAIATGSMHPTIKKGDVVIIEKVEDNYGSIEEGTVLAFEYNKVLIIHRVIRRVEANGEYFFYTKGDYNASEDGYPVTEDMVKGVVQVKIPYLGLPTVWLKEI